MKNLLIVLSGPSGVGKGTIVERLLKSGGYSLSVSCTTRAPREGEKQGVSYFFTDRRTFESGIREGGFLEYSEHFGNLYGTPKAFVEEKLKTDDVILEIEVDGALQVKRAHPEALLIMIAPPDEGELISRLEKRGSESAEKIRERVKRMEYELSKKDEYDYTVINDNLDVAVEEIKKIIEETKRSFL
ncbi:MAG: guanylate kinase [Clostridia bacterium]|nr:guanylate kinase [Clostridia bacterium]